MKWLVELLALSALTVILLACGGEQTAAPDEGAATGTEKPNPTAETPAEPAPDPEPAAPARTTLVGKGSVDTDGGASPEVKVELSFGDDKVVEGTLQIGDTARRIGGVVDGERLRCWLHGGGAGGEVPRGMLTGDARDGGGFGGSFAVSTNGGELALRGKWEASPQ